MAGDACLWARAGMHQKCLYREDSAQAREEFPDAEAYWLEWAAHREGKYSEWSEYDDL